jgi:hypothetical protein
MKTIAVLVLGLVLGRFSKRIEDAIYDQLIVNIVESDWKPGRVTRWLLNH